MIRFKVSQKSPKNLLALLSIKRVPKSTFKFQFRESQQKCIFSNLVWPTLNEGQNSSKYHKNRCRCLSLKWVSKSTLKFQFREFQQKCIFSTLVWPNFNKGQNSSKSHKNRCHLLSLTCVSKSTFKTQLWECQKTAYSQPWMRSKIAPNIMKIGANAYFSNG